VLYLNSGCHWGKAAAVEEKQLLYKLTHIASEVKAAAFEKSGHQKQPPLMQCNRFLNWQHWLRGQISCFWKKWPPLKKTAAIVKRGCHWKRRPSKVATYEAMSPHFKLAKLPQEGKVAVVEKAAAIDKSGHQKRPPLTKVAIKNGHLWGNVANVEKRWLLFKLIHIASEAKAAAFEKSSHQKWLPLTKAAIKNGHLWGNVATVEKRWLLFKLTHIASEAKAAAVEKSGHQKWPPLKQCGRF
jgi:hypothetical protein